MQYSVLHQIHQRNYSILQVVQIMQHSFFTHFYVATINYNYNYYNIEYNIITIIITNYDYKMAELTQAIAKISEVLKKLTEAGTTTTTSNNHDSRGIQLAPFDETNETFDSYSQRLENYLELRNLDKSTNDEQCVKILINCLSPKLYHTLTCLTAPDPPKSKKYTELIELLKNHICPNPSEVAEKHKFALRLQYEGETIANYQAELKRIATNCNFIVDLYFSLKSNRHGSHF